MTRKIKAPVGFRRLKWNEVVNEGDFVINDQQQVVIWEGLHGFFAYNYVKPIYRATKEIPGAKLPQTDPSA